jgi:hypothetical protein
MTQTAIIPDYLKPSIERLETARSASHQCPTYGRNHDGNPPGANPKNELEQENGTDSGAWRTAFRAGGAVITDELKQRHIARDTA